MVKKITTAKIIAQYLNNYEKNYYLRELASLLKKPHQTVKPHLETLVSEGVLTKITRKNITEYSLNFKDKKIYDYLIIAEKEGLMERLKEDIYLKVLFEKLSPFFKTNTFVIFGSAVEKLKKGSDIDLLVIGQQDISQEIKKIENIYNKRIHKIQVGSINKLNLTLIKEIFKHHIIFNNTEYVVRFFGELHGQNKLV